MVWKLFAAHFKNVTDPMQNLHVGTLSLADFFQRFVDWEPGFRAYYAGPEDYNNREHDWLANAVSRKIYDFRRIIEKLTRGKNEALPSSELQHHPSFL